MHELFLNMCEPGNVSLVFYQGRVLHPINDDLRTVDFEQARLLNIPYGVFLIDAFQKEVLAPQDKASEATKGDFKSMLAWRVVDANSDSQEVKGPLCIIAPLMVILTAVAREKINEFTDTYITNACLEVGEQSEDRLFMNELVKHVMPYVDTFYEEYVEKAAKETKTQMVSLVLNQYIRLAKECSEFWGSAVNYNPEILKSDQ